MTDIAKLRERIQAAIKRITSGQGLMRVPVGETDPDIVLAECLNSLSELERYREAQPVAWVCVADTWKVLHFSKHDGWKLEIVQSAVPPIAKEPK